MKWGSERRKVVSGLAEKLGLTTVVASAGDHLIGHKLGIVLDALGLLIGLLFMVLAVIMAPDD